MQGLASFIMRGRLQAAMVASAATAPALILLGLPSSVLLLLLVPLLGLVSSAAVALVTLRHGGLEGLLVGLFAGFASGLVAFVVLGSPLPAIGFAVALWLPVWVLGVVLRRSLSLALTIQLASIIGFLVIAALRLQGVDAEYWIALFEPLRESLVERQVIDAAGSHALVADAARKINGVLGTSFYYQALLALFVGRWWQALLYNPGGFGAEFRELRLNRGVGFLSLGFMLVLLLQPDVQWAAELLMLLTPLLFLQGVAVAHGLANSLRASRGWLIGFYVLLLMPHVQMLVSGLGLVDIWMDVRSRVRKGGRDQD